MKSKLTLSDAFALETQAELIAFVGAGGKSSLMIALAHELTGRLIVTTTTRMFAEQLRVAARSLPAILCWYPDLSPLDDMDAGSQKFLITSKLVQDKVSGVPLQLPSQLLYRPDIDWVLVEADGAKMRPVKAPDAHEPAIPTQTTLVVPMLGIEAVGKEIQIAAHRPERVANLLGKSTAAQFSTADLAQLLTHPQGGLKSVPSEARVIPAINQVENNVQLADARHIAKLALAESKIQQIVICRANADWPVVEVHKRVTAAILAAGQAKRMGQLKQLLPWGATTILGQTIRNIKASAVHDCVVVTGHKSDATAAVAADEQVATVTNPGYAAGEMLSSLQTAVVHLPQQISAVLVMLADQPMVEPKVIDSLLQAYWRGSGDIIAPQNKGKRGNPVIIDRCHFAELLALPSGAAPRDLLRKHEVTLVPVESESVLQDIDDLEDYRRYQPDLF